MAKHFWIVRHGESLYNKWRRESFTKLRLRDMITQDPGIIDPQLSPLGEQQAENLRSRIATPVTVICSPLIRAIQTAVIGFPNAHRIIPHPCCTEQFDTSADAGKSLQELKILYPQLDYSYWEEDVLHHGVHSDQWWWQGQSCQGAWIGLWRAKTPETITSLDKRIEFLERRFLPKIASPLVIVGHSYFFRRWLREPSKLSHCEPILVSQTDTGVIARLGEVNVS